MLEDTSEPQSHYKCFLTCSKNPGEALFLHHIRLVERKIWELVLRWSPREVMASPPWFSEETLRRPSIVTVVVVVKTTVEEGVCVESPLLSILHGPAGLLSDFAPRHSWLLPWGGTDPCEKKPPHPSTSPFVQHTSLSFGGGRGIPPGCSTRP